MDYSFSWKNNGRTKVMIGCGTRPEIIRLAAVIKRCREYYDTCIVYYNKNWDRNLSTVFWEDFELRNENPYFDYIDETVSMKVVRIIQGYVNVFNKMVWRKH